MRKYKIMQIILITIGVALFINGAFMCMVSNLNLGVILTLVLGAFLLACGALYKKICKWTSKGAMRGIKYIVIAMLCAELALIAFVAIYGINDNVQYTEDAVIVLGAGIRGDRVSLPLKLRLDKAVEYHRKNPDAVIVVTGGQGFQETVTEAYAMEKYLLECGVNKEKIIKEEKATSTNENMRFSKEILDTYFSDDYTTVIITNNFHIYRSVAIAHLEGIENVVHMHSGLQWYNLVPCYLRESLAILKMWVFD